MSTKKLATRLTIAAAGAVIITALVVAFASHHQMTKRADVAKSGGGVAAAAATRQSPKEPIGTSENGIFISYPHDNSSIDAPSTYVGGAVAPGSTLTVNDKPVRVNAQGFFVQMVPLSVGSNPIKLVLNGDASKSRALTVVRPAPPAPVPVSPAQIVKSSIHPTQDLGLVAGDLLTLSLRGSPGSQVTAKIGQRTITLQPAGKSNVNVGQNTTYGVTFQNSPASRSDLYTGFYRVTADDAWKQEVPQFTLVNGSDTVQQSGNGKITVVDQPFVATTLHDDTIVRLGPGAGRTTPLAQGVRVLVDGWVGDSYRLEMTPTKHLWIESKDLSTEHETDSPPLATVKTINIENDGNGGARIVVPLNQRLPYEIKQEITDGNRLVMKIYGATADTDWITEPSTSATKATSETEQAPKKGRTFPPAAQRTKNPVSFVTWQQNEDRVYQLTANLNQRQQWGFWASYEDTNLVLHAKGAPHVTLSPSSLKGLRICIDPGHGGMETGAIGLSGTKESTINLGIGKRVQRILEQQCAEVIMTRDSDVDVSLGDRTALAIAKNVDLLVSIHNNSLPDGRDPLKEHGTSSYYYHPQALKLASYIRAGVVQKMGTPDFHTRWQNLALCRPSQMPAQLVEVGFMINPDEYAKLLSSTGQEEAAAGIVQGIHTFLADALNAAPKTTTASRPKHKHPAG